MPSILIADDEPALRLLLRQTLEPLEDEGATLLEAADGQEAVDQVKAHIPDVVLLDVMMPRLNGYQVCQFIRNEPRYDGVTVVFLTARNQEFDRAQGHMAGGDHYVTKPFDPDELLGLVRTILA